MTEYREKLTPKQFNLVKACVTDWKNGLLSDSQAMIIISNVISIDRPPSKETIETIQRLAQDDERIKMKE